MNLNDLKKSTQRTIRKIAKASGISPDEALRKMLKPTSADWVTSHLDYGIANAANN